LGLWHWHLDDSDDIVTNSELMALCNPRADGVVIIVDLFVDGMESNIMMNSSDSISMLLQTPFSRRYWHYGKVVVEEFLEQKEEHRLITSDGSDVVSRLPSFRITVAENASVVPKVHRIVFPDNRIKLRPETALSSMPVSSGKENFSSAGGDSQAEEVAADECICCMDKEAVMVWPKCRHLIVCVPCCHKMQIRMKFQRVAAHRNVSMKQIAAMPRKDLDRALPCPICRQESKPEDRHTWSARLLKAEFEKNQKQAEDISKMVIE